MVICMFWTALRRTGALPIYSMGEPPFAEVPRETQAANTIGCFLSRSIQISSGNIVSVSHRSVRFFINSLALVFQSIACFCCQSLRIEKTCATEGLI
ncbi:Os02g0176300 [Oryza sativa Japonica Group]|uniref:Os02g0176300 protein n=2 Tax=Oryza sativa subsp. japonica TaxID=39947 RepID=Q0E3G2_ORYSJ|nr:hypothetical protein EE612_009208 [Oryza sativa]BAF07976.1 Os02g0176300 [Oryza sativa Japonica Group]BAS77258.1 Os02g0176300 [Oryza sativa Japonica Group]|eukprot:NP_001046062.1 Os02g0176300 [Oryza sativa Japonica Group]